VFITTKKGGAYKHSTVKGKLELKSNSSEILLGNCKFTCNSTST